MSRDWTVRQLGTRIGNQLLDESDNRSVLQVHSFELEQERFLFIYLFIDFAKAPFLDRSFFCRSKRNPSPPWQFRKYPWGRDEYRRRRLNLNKKKSPVTLPGWPKTFWRIFILFFFLILEIDWFEWIDQLIRITSRRVLFSAIDLMCCTNYRWLHKMRNTSRQPPEVCERIDGLTVWQVWRGKF